MTFPATADFEKEFPFQKEVSEQIRFLLGAAVRVSSTHNKCVDKKVSFAKLALLGNSAQ